MSANSTRGGSVSLRLPVNKSGYSLDQSILSGHTGLKRRRRKYITIKFSIKSSSAEDRPLLKLKDPLAAILYFLFLLCYLFVLLSYQSKHSETLSRAHREPCTWSSLTNQRCGAPSGLNGLAVCSNASAAWTKPWWIKGKMLMPTIFRMFTQLWTNCRNLHSLTLVSTQFVSRGVLSSSPSARSGLPGLLIPAEKFNITVSLFVSRYFVVFKWCVLFVFNVYWFITETTKICKQILPAQR